MKIGILDIDFLFNYYSFPRLNVEIMKMCEYYNNLYDTSALLLDLHADFNQYDKIIVVSDRTFVERDLQQRIASSSAEVEYYGAI